MFLLLEAGVDAGFNATSLLSMAPFALIIVVFYFFMIRPENKKKKRVEEMRSGLIVGDDVTTVGGMVGKIVSIKDEFVTFETGEDRVRIQVARWAISSTAKGAEES